MSKSLASTARPVVEAHYLGYTGRSALALHPMPGPTIKLLVTDLDNTLYDWVGFFAKAFRAMIDEAVELLGVERELLLDELQKVHRRHHDSERPWSLAETSCALVRWPGSSLETRIERLDSAFHAFNRARKQLLRLYPGVGETLAQIRDTGVPIVAHTEASAVNALGRVTRLGLDEFLARLYAADGGDELRDPPLPLIPVPREVHKPDPRILLDICADYGVTPEHTLYVGDSISRDVGMARQVGMHAAWAAYGTRHAAEDWATLTRVTHWTDEDVARAAAAHERFGNSTPEVVLEQFGELLEHYEFGTAEAGALTRTA
jgi:FMN phosphatase YigB (HAD superfamily)